MSPQKTNDPSWNMRLTGYLLLILALSLTLAGCASQSTISASECPQLPPKPVLSQQKPSVSYSETARQELSELREAMEKWQQKLTDTRLTQKP